MYLLADSVQNQITLQRHDWRGNKRWLVIWKSCRTGSQLFTSPGCTLPLPTQHRTCVSCDHKILSQKTEPWIDGQKSGRCDHVVLRNILWHELPYEDQNICHTSSSSSGKIRRKIAATILYWAGSQVAECIVWGDKWSVSPFVAFVRVWQCVCEAGD